MAWLHSHEPHELEYVLGSFDLWVFEWFWCMSVRFQGKWEERDRGLGRVTV
ncbi:S ribonuclease [Pyrus ussuriensis x Pyrus communis]|uniref:S ribonuclease n=1 Tax=Pyrus ussuriensis x Pyrus communis TaxID=2448454 RepID=A0A5N5G6Z2_9ROSA|nr:S ribonuclease [Pyrus ussuriensis x Pyrus communis]